MENLESRGVAIVGVGAVLPDAPDVPTFWRNVTAGRDSISDVPPDRWDPDVYYDPDPSAPDRTYSRIGGWVREFAWDPLAWKLPIPPRVSEAMDRTQKWAVMASREALADAGWPGRGFDGDRTAVIFGNAMAGDLHYRTAMRIHLPEFTRKLEEVPLIARLSTGDRTALVAEVVRRVGEEFPDITEDTMPGELANIIAGRVANLFNFRGPNFVTDAACASAMAAITSAVRGLLERDFDTVLTGGVDSNMSASTFTKFCKIGALSATGSRPYAAGADGFVMGEGAAVFVLRRLTDAERNGDRIYAVLRGIGGSSDGKGKGITAPNPIGQRLAVERAWQQAGVVPDEATLMEGHGTSTRVGDVIEVESLSAVFARFGLAAGSIPLGSVKSNIGHLKGAAGAAGILKSALALHHKLLPPSLHCEELNPNIDFAASPFFVNREMKEWEAPDGRVRRAGVSAFGFGGTNFHTVLEEHGPGQTDAARQVPASAVATPPVSAAAMPSVSAIATPPVSAAAMPPVSAIATPPGEPEPRRPLRGALILGADTPDLLRNRLLASRSEVAAGRPPNTASPRVADLRARERIAIDFSRRDELLDRIDRALKVIDRGDARAWKALRARGIHRGSGLPSGTAFLYTGQGSQYANMLGSLRRSVAEVRDTFAEADAVMTPILGRPLSEFVFIDSDDPRAVADLEEHLRQTEITQPAVLTTDEALTRLLRAYGILPDMVMGHSLGEYGALVAAGALDFADALRAVSARAHAMREVSLADNGRMTAVAAPLDELQALLDRVDGYVVIANLNSLKQAVIGGATHAVEAAERIIGEAGYAVRRVAVSHAFHTQIVGPASEPLVRYLKRLTVRPPMIPVVANATGGLYPMDPGAHDSVIDLLGRQIASPVQFVRGLRALYDHGIRTFIEVGPKRALHSFVEDVLGDDPDVVAFFTNHPKTGDVESFNSALCALWAAGLGDGVGDEELERPGRAGAAAPIAPPAGLAVAPAPPVAPPAGLAAAPAAPTAPPAGLAAAPAPPVARSAAARDDDRAAQLGRLFLDFLERSVDLVGTPRPHPVDEPVVVTGAAVGLPGAESVFDDANVGRILRGDSFIGSIPMDVRRAMVEKHITRLVKTDQGGPHFETIDSVDEAIKLAGRAGAFDLGEFGVPEERIPALNAVTRLAMAVGLEALRDAGIPLAMSYRTTTRGTFLPDRWMLPEALRDETGVILASAFPDSEAWADEVTAFERDRAFRQRLAELSELRNHAGADPSLRAELDLRAAEIRAEIQRLSFRVDRRLLFRILSMGHSQFAEYVGARGPNSQVNAACASTPQAIGLAEDWIRRGRCRRVIVLSADNVTSDRMLEWIGAGFLASGAAATDERVEDAVLPFDRRRHGMVVGMGAAALVIETADAATERGLVPICEVLGTVIANSAFHGTRLDTVHMGQVMERLVSQAEDRWGIRRDRIAPETVFVSHETYTPARGGSAQAEVDALRLVFGRNADQVVMANTKGFTGHAMGAGIEDVVAVKSLETGIVPPVANFREVDPSLGRLNLSKGGRHDVRYALRLGAGFGSQIAMTLLRWTPPPDGRHRQPEDLGYAYRVADGARWSAWLRSLSGHDRPALEVVGRTLRFRDDGPPASDATDRRTSADEVVETGPAETELEEAVRVVPFADRISDRVLEIVAGVTGYPTDMLDPELDMEADLGIDTVKQAETFAAIRAAFSIERDESLRLRDFPTLAHVIAFAEERAPEGPGASPPATGAPAEPEPGSASPPATGAPAEPEPGSARPPVPTDASTVLLAGTIRDEILETVVALVAELTGYPADMLDPDLDMEADLGVDTVKQAEMFAAVRERYGIERDESLRLGDFPTLADVARFVRERAPAKRGGDGVQAPGSRPAAGAAPLLTLRVPSVRVIPPATSHRGTGVRLEAGRRVVLMQDRSGVARALRARLEARGVVILAIEDRPTREELAERLASFGPIDGVYWLPALDRDGDPARLSREEREAALHARVRLLHETARVVFDSLTDGSFFIAATRLDGAHGFGGGGIHDAFGGAVTGFMKALRRERPGAVVKAVDFEASRRTAEPADRLIEETLFDGASVEVGYRAGTRTTIGVDERPPAASPVALPERPLVVVTGAAGSIVSAILGDLAAAHPGTYWLLDVVPRPSETDPDLDEHPDALRRILFERLQATGERATPARVESVMSTIERRVSARAGIRAVERAGGTARYVPVDLLDAAAVDAALGPLRGERVDVLIHAAGLEKSRILAEKDAAEFDRVFDVKAVGYLNVLSALRDVPITSVVAFSSIAGRFGNAGQTDYSAANDLLAKVTASLAPRTRGITVDWTAWARIGMASRGSIPTMMARAGIDMLDPDVGIPVVRVALESWPAGEVIVAGSLGEMVQATGGDGALVPGSGPMLGRVSRVDPVDGVTLELALDPKAQPFLFDHRIDGTVVLPGVMGIEAFVEAARFLVPDRYASGLEEVRFTAPFKFYRDEARTIEVVARSRPEGVDVLVDCRLVGRRYAPGSAQPTITTHFEATVRMTRAAPSLDEVPLPGFVTGTGGRPATDLYRVYFHGPSFQVVDRLWKEDARIAGRFPATLPACHAPAAEPLRGAPRLVELAFQTAGALEMTERSAMGLPRFIRRLRFGSGDPAEVAGDVALAERLADGSFDVALIRGGSRCVLTLEGYRTAELPGGVPQTAGSILAAVVG